MARSRSPFVIAVVIGVVALLGLLVYGLGSANPDRSIDNALERGERGQAPDFALARLSGEGRKSLSDYRGKVVVLNFWASWCEPCRAESPLLQRWHERIAKDGGTVLGVDVLDASDDARAFVRKYKLRYPMLRDVEGDTLDDYGVGGYPETFVIDRQGRIAATARGPIDERFMRTRVVPLLKAGS